MSGSCGVFGTRHRAAMIDHSPFSLRRSVVQMWTCCPPTVRPVGNYTKMIVSRRKSWDPTSGKSGRHYRVAVFGCSRAGSRGAAGFLLNRAHWCWAARPPFRTGVRKKSRLGVAEACGPRVGSLHSRSALWADQCRRHERMLRRTRRWRIGTVGVRARSRCVRPPCGTARMAAADRYLDRRSRWDVGDLQDDWMLCRRPLALLGTDPACRGRVVGQARPAEDLYQYYADPDRGRRSVSLTGVPARLALIARTVTISGRWR